MIRAIQARRSRFVRDAADLLYDKDLELATRLIGLLSINEPAVCIECGEWTPNVHEETQEVELVYERSSGHDRLTVRVRVFVYLDNGLSNGGWDYEVCSAHAQFAGLLSADLGTKVKLSDAEMADLEHYADERLTELPLLRVTAAHDDEMERTTCGGTPWA